jgi:hypothetical protein
VPIALSTQYEGDENEQPGSPFEMSDAAKKAD